MATDDRDEYLDAATAVTPTRVHLLSSLLCCCGFCSIFFSFPVILIAVLKNSVWNGVWYKVQGSGKHHVCLSSTLIDFKGKDN